MGTQFLLSFVYMQLSLVYGLYIPFLYNINELVFHKLIS